MNDVGERLRELRISAGLTMEEMGKAVGASKMAVSRWEAGQRKPKPEYIKAYANFFQIPEKQIIYGYPDEYVMKIAKRELRKKGYADDTLSGLSSRVYVSFADFSKPREERLDYYPSEEEIKKEVDKLNPDDSFFVQALLEACEELTSPFSYLNDYLILNEEESKSLINNDITPEEYKEIKERLSCLLSDLENLSDEFELFYMEMKDKF